MQKIDLKDKKLIVALSRNARESHTQFGKLIGISKSAVPYRIKRLEKEGIIKRFLPVINLSAIGYTTYNLFLKIHTTKQQEQKFFDYLNTHSSTTWVCRFLGAWDFQVEVVAKDMHALNIIIEDIAKQLGSCLEAYQTHIALEIYKVEHLPKQFVEEANLQPIDTPSRAWRENIILDPIDRSLLHALTNNALAPLHELAKICGTTLDVIHYRMKKLWNEGVIIQYIPFIDLEPLGYKEYMLVLQLQNLTVEKAQSLKQYFLQQKHCKYAFRGASQLEIISLIAVQEIRELDTIICEIKEHFFEVILDVQHYFIIEQGKFELFPKVLVEENLHKKESDSFK